MRRKIDIRRNNRIIGVGLASSIYALVSKKTNAFTILEAVISTTIIAILIGMSAMIYANVLASDKPLAIYKAQFAIREWFHNLTTNKAFFNKSVEFDNCEIVQEVDFYRGNKHLYEVKYSVKSGEKVWWEERYLVQGENLEPRG